MLALPSPAVIVREYVVGAPEVNAALLKLSKNAWVCPDAFVQISIIRNIAVRLMRAQITPKKFFVVLLLGAGWYFAVCGWIDMFLNKEREW